MQRQGLSRRRLDVTEWTVAVKSVISRLSVTVVSLLVVGSSLVVGVYCCDAVMRRSLENDVPPP